MTNRKLSRVGDDLGRIMRALAIDGPARESVAVASWRAVVGERIDAATRVEGVAAGVLEVRTRSSGWTQELTFCKRTILRRLNARAGGEPLTDIRFRTGSLPEHAAPGAGEDDEAEEASPEVLAAIALPAPAASQIEAASAHPDADLAALIRRALTHEWRLNEWRRLNGHQPCRQCGTLCPPSRALCPACASAKHVM